METFNNLPAEIALTIFEHLDLKDLLNCRLVSKKWQLYSDAAEVKQLVIADHESALPLRQTAWYRTEMKICARNCISFTEVNRCPFILSKVERLRIESNCCYNLNGFLAKFPKLRHLEIVWLQEEYQTVKLDLPVSLKTFDVGSVLNMKLILNATNLRSVFCGVDIKNIIFTHPESIKHLKINHLDLDKYEELQIFPNVRSFRFVGRSYILNEVGLDMIKLFPKVKEIHFGMCGIEDDVNFDKLESAINDVIYQRDMLDLIDLKIFCEGKIIVDETSFRSEFYQ